MIILDNDGVMTDGKVYINTQGAEAKAYPIRDGFGVVMARQAGVKLAIITGLLTPVVQTRAGQLGITELHKAFIDKLDCLKDILKRFDLTADEAAYMGDDLFDLPAIRYVGLGAAPADAHPFVIENADWVSPFRGGEGAVRDLIELVLKAQGRWEDIVRQYAGL